MLKQVVLIVFVAFVLLFGLAACQNTPVPEPKEMCVIEGEVVSISAPFTNVFGLDVVSVFWQKAEAPLPMNEKGLCLGPTFVNTVSDPVDPKYEVWQIMPSSLVHGYLDDQALPAKVKIHYLRLYEGRPPVVVLRDFQLVVAVIPEPEKLDSKVESPRL